MPDTRETKSVGVTEIFTRNRNSKSRILVNVGGSGSSKSHSIAQLMIEKLLNEHDKQFLIVRKTMPALKRSSYGLIVDLLNQYGLYDKVQHNKTDNIIRYQDNEMWFFGLDEPTKTKSIAGGASYIWLEEADEFTYDDFVAFKLQLRRHTEPGEQNVIYLSFNPADGSGWLATKLCKGMTEVSNAQTGALG